MKAWIFAAALLAPAAAYAHPSDHCIHIADESVAKRAARALSGQEVVDFCDSCGETAPGVPYVIKTAVSVDDGNSFHVESDGNPVDLATTYVRTSPELFENVALLVDCPVRAALPSLRVDGETPNGVMISADTTPVVPDVEAAPVEPPAPPPAPPPVSYSTTIIYATPWFAIALTAGLAGCALGAMLTLMLVALRRRRPMEPRATKLGS